MEVVLSKNGARALKPQRFHILLALADEDRHGSAIVREVLEQSGGRIRLWPVMLYKSLDTLMEMGLIVELTDPESRPEGASGRRRYFHLTEAGKTVLSGEIERLVALGNFASRKLAVMGEGRRG